MRDATLVALALSLSIAGGALPQISDDVVKIGVLTQMSCLFSGGTGKEVIGGDHLNKPDVASNIAQLVR